MYNKMVDKKLLDDLDIDKDTFEKSKDILPTLDLGKYPEDSQVFCQIVGEIKKVKHKDTQGEDKNKEIETPVIPVAVSKVIMPSGDETPINEKMTMWLSSKSLRLGLLRALDNIDPENIIGTKIKISKGKAFYKKINAEQTCYNVSLE